MLGFAGKDGRCYFSLEKLGMSLGVSGRQARDYVKELTRAGLVVVEQRGLRKTNIYLFVWTGELEQLVGSIPADPDDPDDNAGGMSQDAPTDRNNRSGQERNTPSGPIGINSAGISSLESSSSSSPRHVAEDSTTKMTTHDETLADTNARCDDNHDQANRTAQAILQWAKDQGIQRLRSDRRIGPPEKEQLAQWSSIFECRGVRDERKIIVALGSALAAANRTGEWRNWAS